MVAQIDESEWEEIYDLRDRLEGDDRIALRRFIKYTEHLEKTVKTLMRLEATAKSVEILQKSLKGKGEEG